MSPEKVLLLLGTLIAVSLGTLIIAYMQHGSLVNALKLAIADRFQFDPIFVRRVDELHQILEAKEYNFLTLQRARDEIGIVLPCLKKAQQRRIKKVLEGDSITAQWDFVRKVFC